MAVHAQSPRARHGIGRAALIAWGTLLALSAAPGATPAEEWLVRALDELGRPRPSPDQVHVLGAIVASVAQTGVDRAVALAREAMSDVDTDTLLLEACESVAPAVVETGVALARRIADPARRDEALLMLAGLARTSKPRVAADALGALSQAAPSDLLVEDVAAGLAADNGAAAVTLAAIIADERSRGWALGRIAKAAGPEHVDALEKACAALREPVGLCAARLGMGELRARAGDRQGSRADLGQASDLLPKVPSDADRRRLREGIAAALGPDGVALLEPEIAQARAIRRTPDRIRALTALIGPVGAADPARAEAMADEALSVIVTLPDNGESLGAGIDVGRAVLPFAPERARAIIDQAARAALPGGSRPIEVAVDRARVIATAGAALLPLDADRAFAMLAVAIDTLAGDPVDEFGGPPPTVIDAFAAQDAGRTEAVVRRLRRPAGALCRMAEQVAETDPDAALRLAHDALAGAGEGALRDGIACRLAPRVARIAPAEALAMADALPAISRGRVLASVIGMLPPDVAVQQIDRALAIADPDARLAALCSVASATVTADPGRALSIAELASAGEVEGLRAEVLCELAHYQPALAVERCRDLRRADSRDRVIAAAAHVLAATDPAGAIALAGTATGPASRLRLRVELAEIGVAGAASAARSAAEDVADPVERLPLLVRLLPSLDAAEAATLGAEIADGAQGLDADRLGAAQRSDIVAGLALVLPDRALTLARAASLPDARARSLLAAGLALLGTSAERGLPIIDEALAVARGIEDAEARSDRLRQMGGLLTPVRPDRAREAFQAALEAAFDAPGIRARSAVALSMAQLDVSTGASWAYAVAQESPLEAIDTLIEIGRSAAEREPIRAAMALSQAAQLTDAIGSTEDVDPAQADRLRAEQLVRIARDLASVPDGVDAARGLLEQAQAALPQDGDASVMPPELARELAVTGIRLQARVDPAGARDQAAALPGAADRVAARLALASDGVDTGVMLGAALDETDELEDAAERVAALKRIAEIWAPLDPAQVAAVVDKAPPGADRAAVALAAARALREASEGGREPMAQAPGV